MNSRQARGGTCFGLSTPRSEKLKNAHDPRAIPLDFGEMHVGYVPRDHNTITATLLAQGAPLECRIVAVTLNAEPWKMIESEIRLA